MIFVLGKKELLLKSKFYNPEYNWDYPIDELDYVINENTDPDMVYVVGDDKRIYETFCRRDEIRNLYKELNEEMKLRTFELASLSVLIKVYCKFGMESVNKRLEDWKERMATFNPNVDEILSNFKTIIAPLEERKRIQENNNEDTLEQ